MFLGQNNNTSTNGNSSIPLKDKKQIIFEKSSVISGENSNMIIRKYSNLPLNQNNAKILLFIGENQEGFINSIINIYSDVNYKDNFRYKIENNNLNETLRTYKVYSTNKEKDIFIISFPFFNRVEEIFNSGVMKDLLDKKNIKNINYLFITVQKGKFLDKKEFIFFIFLINLLFDKK